MNWMMLLLMVIGILVVLCLLAYFLLSPIYNKAMEAVRGGSKEESGRRGNE